MTTPSAEEIRRSQRAAWAGLSASWEKWDALIMAQLRPVGDAMVERLALADDQCHLDIASGTGEPGLTIARRVPRAQVVLTDLSPEMLAVAARRAGAEGIENVTSRVCSADDLPFADGSFDSVTVRFGYMFFPDTAMATSELVRVLRPAGRLAASVWVRPEANPWTSIVMQAIASEVPLTPPHPDRPHMYRCARPGQISALFEDAGLIDVDEWDVGCPLVTRSPEEYWEMLSEHVSLAAAALQQVDADARERIRERVLVDVQHYEQGGEVRVPGMARCVVGTRPPLAPE